jgi:hypothetical protein
MSATEAPAPAASQAVVRPITPPPMIIKSKFATGAEFYHTELFIYSAENLKFDCGETLIRL